MLPAARAGEAAVRPAGDFQSRQDHRHAANGYVATNHSRRVRAAPRHGVSLCRHRRRASRGGEVHRRGPVPQDGRDGGHDVPQLHGDAGRTAHHAGAGQRAAAGPLLDPRGGQPLGPARDRRRDGSLPLLQGLQERVPIQRRHGTAEGRVAAASARRAWRAAAEPLDRRFGRRDAVGEPRAVGLQLRRVGAGRVWAVQAVHGIRGGPVNTALAWHDAHGVAESQGQEGPGAVSFGGKCAGLRISLAGAAGLDECGFPCKPEAQAREIFATDSPKTIGTYAVCVARFVSPQKRPRAPIRGRVHRHARHAAGHQGRGAARSPRLRGGGAPPRR